MSIAASLATNCAAVSVELLVMQTKRRPVALRKRKNSAAPRMGVLPV
jgi:hypothetical protein